MRAALLFLLLAPLVLSQDLARNLRHYETLSSSDLSHSIVKRGADPTR